MEPHELYDEKFNLLVEEATKHPIDSEESTRRFKNLETFSKCRPPQPEPEPEPAYVPKTKWEKFKHGLAAVWDNETTRVLIKSGFAAGGVAAVAYTTIHKDHVLERNAISQANQKF